MPMTLGRLARIGVPKVVHANEPRRPAWPSPQHILRAQGKTGVAAWGKAWLRHWSSLPWRPVLLDTLARDPYLGHLFESDPRYAHCAQSHFVDRRRSMAQRIGCMAQDLATARTIFGPALAERLARRERVALWALDDDTHLALELNDLSLHEGLWALNLRDGAGRRLYHLSFTFIGPSQLLVATLQGPGGDSAAALETIRSLTKRAEGLRPPAVLLSALRAICAVWGIVRLAGIEPAHHVKGRWNLRGKRLRFDYPAFWLEQRGERAVDGHWSLPLWAPMRAPQDAPSNKRAMYRRRQAVHAGMVDAIGSELGRSPGLDPGQANSGA